MVACPNCSQPLEAEPVVCPRCGYRRELAGELLWLYAGGSTFLVIGFVLGLAALAVEGRGTDHWSHALDGWFPWFPWVTGVPGFPWVTWAPWPPSHAWIAYLIVGIGLSVCGLGLTRHRRSAGCALGVLLAGAATGAVWALARQGSAAGGAPGSPAPWIVLAAALSLFLLLLRCFLALRRTPPRDVRALQR